MGWKLPTYRHLSLLDYQMVVPRLRKLAPMLPMQFLQVPGALLWKLVGGTRGLSKSKYRKLLSFTPSRQTAYQNAIGLRVPCLLS